MARPRSGEEVPFIAVKKDRTAAIQAWVEKRYRLTGEMEALREEHIKPLQQEISADKGRLSQQLGIPRKYLDDAYKTYALKRDAEAFEDDEEKDETLGYIRELYSTLQNNGMVDLVEAIQTVSQKAASKKAGGKKAGGGNVVNLSVGGADQDADRPQDDLVDDRDDRDPETDVAFITARAAGENAARSGENFNDNPYEKGSSEATAFEIGFLKARGALAHDAGQGLNDNPSTEGTMGWVLWRKGWQAAADGSFASAGAVSAGEASDEIASEEFDDELDQGDGATEAAE
ncbi:MAG: hypothetical protein ACMVO3_22845 [Thalassobaculum sp.]